MLLTTLVIWANDGNAFNVPFHNVLRSDFLGSGFDNSSLKDSKFSTASLLSDLLTIVRTVFAVEEYYG
jgi:hypothetical protein